MKILCVCDAGQVRSVAMSGVLQARGYFACATSRYSWESLSASARYDDLYWDVVLHMYEGGKHNIGGDEWGDPTNPQLLMLCNQKANEMGLKGVDE